MSDNISIADLNKAAVLAALFNGSRPQGLGFLAYSGDGMTTEQAQAILDEGQTYFDYLQGRVMKVDLSGDSFSPWGYDRDNGQNAAKTIIDELRSNNGDPNGNMTQGIHEQGRERAAIIASEHLGGQTHSTGPGSLEMGFDELSDAVRERIKPYLNE